MIKKILFVMAVIVMASCKKEETVRPVQMFDIEVLSGDIQISYSYDGENYVMHLDEGYKPVWNPDHIVDNIHIHITSHMGIGEYSVNGETYTDNRGFKL